MARLRSLRNVETGSVLATQVARADNPWTRLVGLLPKAALSPDDGLWIAGCASVHTLGMRASLDLYFLDSENRVMKIARSVAPGRFAVTCGGAKTVVELGASDAPRPVALGDRFALVTE